MPFLWWDPTLILLIPAIILSIYAQAKVHSTFQKYLRVQNYSGLTGAAVARRLLDRNGLENVRVELIPRTLSDHYDPRTRVLRLSPEVYQNRSVASLSVAAHETGHALQHARGYAPFGIRAAFVPLANFGSSLAIPLLLIGFIFTIPVLVRLGVYAFSAVVAFQLVTLPVEFNASSRALTMLQHGGFLDRQELTGAKKVLDAAALTYVAAALAAALNLVRLVLISGMLGGRDE